MRGKVSGFRFRGGVPRITPAYAGKSTMRTTTANCPRDHPRVCGEKKAFANEIEMELGSPPRMRGKGFVTLTYDNEHRITPAYAGKSLLVCCFQLRSWDHPRVCGEKNRLTKEADRYGGSPPRMRGKAFFGFTGFLYARITPAYAGKSPNLQHPGPGNEDHPRVCGEKTLAVQSSNSHQGSPPRMRGKGLTT